MPAKNFGGIPSRSAISATESARSPARAIPTSARIPYVVLRVSIGLPPGSWGNHQRAVDPRLTPAVVVSHGPNVDGAAARRRPRVEGTGGFTVAAERALRARFGEDAARRVPGDDELLRAFAECLR